MDWDRLLPVSPESVPVCLTSERRLTNPPLSAHSALESLSTIADFLVPASTNRADFLKECASGAFDGAIAAYMTFPSVSITGPWDSGLIAALPKSLIFCAHNGAGYNQVDVQACSAREPPIRVSNVPKLADDATADTAVFLILGALRNFNSSMFALRQGQWRTTPEPPALGHDPRGKVLGILGMGGIGRNLMRKCEVFGFRTVYHNRSKLSEEEAGGAEWVGFEELLAKADVLSLNLPLNVSLAGGGLFGFLGYCWLQYVAQMI
jgi:glyoxylate reductase